MSDSRTFAPARRRLALLAAWLGLAAGARADDQRFVFEKAEMAVPFRITLYAPDADAARLAAEAAFRRVETLNSILSDYDPDSELSRLGQSSGQGKTVKVSTPLWRVIERSQIIAEQSAGAFDVTVGPLVNLWRRMRRQAELPTPELLAEMRGRVGWRNLRLLPETQSVELLKPDMRLDVGGIAKGFAADEAIAVLKSRGLPRALVAASGDIVAGDPPPGEPGWKVAIEGLAVGDPPAAQEVILLANRGVSTSGDAYQFVEIGGVRYSHIIDPRTGIGLTGRSLVTVVAPDGLTADGLDTAIDILGNERGLELLAKWPGTSVRMQRLVGGKVETVRSAEWPKSRGPRR
ncbi:MAG TPA: FAD:protein FMN transferase [Chthoniobacteraceae bacterium]|jgi:thiamine biosynthesis lipoprotein|nr:FAD:protein FMN transferase [Chthoniobacteraceae bacterium]